MVASLLPPDELPNDTEEVSAETDEVPTDPLRAAVMSGRVLLLEDDPDFKELIRIFLTENGYTVVTVANGGEGVREVLMGDFAAVICDLMMPTLPGDMFYRAIERIRPDLCQRLIFMTGFRGHVERLDSLGIVNPRLLMKPFQLDELLNMVAVVQLASFFEEMQAQSEPPAPPALPAPSENAPAAPAPHPSRAPVPQPRPVLVHAPERSAARGGAFTAACFALAVAILAIFGGWYYVLWQRAEELTTELAAAEREGSAAARKVAAAEESRVETEALLARPRLIAAERAADKKWAAALEGLAVNVGSGIEIKSVEAAGAAENPGRVEMRVEGLSKGAEALAVADRFRAAVQEGLARRFDVAVETKFAFLEQEKDGADAGDPRARFVMIATVGAPSETAAVKYRAGGL